MNTERDKWLNKSDQDLLRDCIFTPQKRSGKGGQKVNKSSSALRLKHIPSGISVIASESRYQTENRTIALKKLRRKIAFEIRIAPKENALNDDQIPSLKNPEYPIWIANILDTMEAKNYSVSDTASELKTTTGRLVKILSRDPELWQKINNERKKRSLYTLTI